MSEGSTVRQQQDAHQQPSAEGEKKTWDEHYEDLKAFQIEHGHCRPRATTKLGRWVGSQRKIRQEMMLQEEHNGGNAIATSTAMLDEHKRRMGLLEAIGFDWETESEKKERRWQMMYQLLQDYGEEFGHITPKVHESYRGETIGHWVSTQQSNYRDGKLKEHRLALLESIDFVWIRDERLLWKDTRPLGKLDDIWKEKFDLLCEYKDQHGDTLVPTGYMVTLENLEECHLGGFVTLQRRLYNDGLLKQERLNKLEQIGFVFEIDVYDANASQNQKAWDQMFQKLTDYKESHGHCDVPAKDKNGDEYLTNLGAWTRHQRVLYTRGDLEKTRFQRLEALGITWSPIDERWDEMVRHLRAYKEKFGDCLVPYLYKTPGEGAKLGSWIQTVRGARRGTKGKPDISDERIAELDELGFEWDNLLAKQWDIMYTALKKYKEMHGNCRVPQSYKGNPNDNEVDLPTNLGNWVSYQRQTLEAKLEATGDPMYIERRKRLEEIGFDFSLAHVNQENWETMLKALKSYQQEFGDCNVPYSYVGDSNLPTSLGKWVYNQRRRIPSKAATNKEMFTERQRMLDETPGFSWKSSPQQRKTTTSGSKTAMQTLLFIGREIEVLSVKTNKYLKGKIVEYVKDVNKYKIHLENRDVVLDLKNPKLQWRFADMAGRHHESNKNELTTRQVSPEESVEHHVFVERQKQLDAVGFNWDGNALHNNWMMMFERLKQYHAENGNCRVPGNYDNNCVGLPAKLGNWVGVQKTTVPTKAATGHPVYVERKKYLDSLDFEYDFIHDAQWEKNFARLKRYYEAHGDCNVPKDHVDQEQGEDTTSLNAWVRNQRKILERAEKGEEKYVERKRLLDSLDFDWEGVDEKLWMAMFCALKSYKETNGHCDVPFGYGRYEAVDEDTHRPLGLWCYDQRKIIPERLASDNGIYDYAERKRLLDSIGFSWKVLSEKEKRWNAFFDQLVAFKEAHGHCRVPVEEGIGDKSLYGWVKNQQNKLLAKAERGDPIYVERKRRLEEIGFEWHGIMDDTWEKMRLALVEYKEKHGHTRVPYRGKGSDGGPTGSLGKWVYNARTRLLKRAEAGDSDAIAKKQKLDEMDFEWTDVSTGRWETMFSGLKRFHEKYGHCKVKRDYKDDNNPLPSNLGSWLSIQRKQIPEKVAEGDEVANERKARLDSLGFVWQTRAPPKAYVRNGQTIAGKKISTSETQPLPQDSPSKSDQSTARTVSQRKNARTTPATTLEKPSKHRKSTVASSTIPKGAPGPSGAMVLFPEYDGTVEPEMWKKPRGQFIARNRKKTKAALPEAERKDKQRLKEVLGDRWSSLQDSEKEEYRSWAKWDKERYSRDEAIYELVLAQQRNKSVRKRMSNETSKSRSKKPRDV